MSIKNAKGTCLCGAVTIVVDEMKPNVGACHCGMCRKWSAGPFFAVDCGNSMTVDGERELGIYNSSEWAERAFCKQCGTNMFYRVKQSGQCYVSAELFENTQFILDHQIFIDDKPEYYSFANQTKNMTGAEVFATFSAE